VAADPVADLLGAGLMIYTGDCIEVMQGMEPDSVDAIVTDPPYGLEFMGKRWDAFKSPGRGARVRKERAAEMTPVGQGHTDSKGPFLAAGVDQYIAGTPFQAWCEAWGREALRVAKPGAYLLAFGGTRTHHRLVCGLEDAGWIIRDELDWIYASGFPKGKANLKPAHEPIVLARKPGALRPLAIDECRIPGVMDGTWGADQSGARSAIREGGASLYGQVTGNGVSQQHEAGRWPSNVLLSDPALFDEKNAEVVGSGAVQASPGNYERGVGVGNNIYGVGMGNRDAGDEQIGFGDSGGYSRFFIVPKADRADREPVLRGQLIPKATHPLDEQTISTASNRRCQTCGLVKFGQPHCECLDPVWAESSIRENAHPTVKPTDLMRHLVRLITPKGGTVLDCFLGSGSTALAAELEGFQWIGIEKEPEYVKISEARLNHTQKGMGL
jgi:DNA modification methylase